MQLEEINQKILSKKESIKRCCKRIKQYKNKIEYSKVTKEIFSNK